MSRTARTSPIKDAAGLRTAILERFDALSPKLRQIAQFLLDDPHSAAIENLATLGARIGVPPSALVRFAKTMGFQGAGPMQRLLKDDLLALQPASAYHQRARQFQRAAGETRRPGPADLLRELVEASSLSLNHLLDAIDAAALERALTMIGTAQTVHVAGFRRSFAVAAYLAYLLQRSGKKAVLVDGIGGFSRQQGGQFGPTDLLIAITFAPYADETRELLDQARDSGAMVTILTDRLATAPRRPADCVLQIHETEVRGFRPLSAAMCVVQVLGIAHAFDDED
jgi:DNA-binding MurR/RpiR family transcriptional regulator